MVLYHGSKERIPKPLFGVGNPHNDYGLGFYCTQNQELAFEWGCSSGGKGFVNRYKLEEEGLSFLSLSDYSILYWITVLLQNRTFFLKNEIAETGKDFLLSHFSLDLKTYDVIRGYRADDSYFAFAEAFLNNAISVQRLSQAMHLGDLGEQIVIMSKKGFAHLHFEKAIPIKTDLYYHLRVLRENYARRCFLKNKPGDPIEDPLYLSDVMKGIDPNDPRLF